MANDQVTKKERVHKTHRWVLWNRDTGEVVSTNGKTKEAAIARMTWEGCDVLSIFVGMADINTPDVKMGKNTREGSFISKRSGIVEKG